jgi:hypothetical protein
VASSFAMLEHHLVLIPQLIGAAKFGKIEHDLSQLNRLDIAKSTRLITPSAHSRQNFAFGLVQFLTRIQAGCSFRTDSN